MDTAIEVADQSAAAEDPAKDIEGVARTLPGDLLIVDAAKQPQTIMRCQSCRGRCGQEDADRSSGTPMAGLVAAQAE